MFYFLFSVSFIASFAGFVSFSPVHSFTVPENVNSNVPKNAIIAAASFNSFLFPMSCNLQNSGGL